MSDGMGRELAYLSSHATNRYFIPNWGNDTVIILLARLYGVGIHNTLEAAVWNMPVIFGPNNKKFQEAQGLLKSGGGFEIQNYESFEGLMNSMMNDEAFLKQAGDKAGAFVASLSGATDKVLSKVQLLV